MTPDAINALFEAGGAFFMAVNVRRVLIDRSVRGVDWRATCFFVMWGYWNLFYYPRLDQVLSFSAGVLLSIVNTTYLALLLLYVNKDRKNVRERP